LRQSSCSFTPLQKFIIKHGNGTEKLRKLVSSFFVDFASEIFIEEKPSQLPVLFFSDTNFFACVVFLPFSFRSTESLLSDNQNLLTCCIYTAPHDSKKTLQTFQNELPNLILVLEHRLEQQCPDVAVLFIFFFILLLYRRFFDNARMFFRRAPKPQRQTFLAV